MRAVAATSATTSSNSGDATVTNIISRWVHTSGPHKLVATNTTQHTQLHRDNTACNPARVCPSVPGLCGTTQQRFAQPHNQVSLTIPASTRKTRAHTYSHAINTSRPFMRIQYTTDKLCRYQTHLTPQAGRHTAPHSTAPYRTVPCRTVPCRAVPCVPCRTVPCLLAGCSLHLKATYALATSGKGRGGSVRHGCVLHHMHSSQA